MTRPRSRRYSYAFSKFVNCEDDLPGLIAYALYKAAKVEHLKKFNQEKGRDAWDDEAYQWSDIHSTTTQIDLYRQKACNIIETYREQEIIREIPLLEKKILASVENNTLQQIHSKVCGLTGWQGLRASLATNVFASIVWVLVIAAVIYVERHKNTQDLSPPTSRTEQPQP